MKKTPKPQNTERKMHRLLQQELTEQNQASIFFKRTVLWDQSCKNLWVNWFSHFISMVFIIFITGFWEKSWTSRFINVGMLLQ